MIPRDPRALRRALLPALAAPLLATGAAAQATTPRAAEDPHAGAPVAHAVRTAQPIRVDGRLDEEAWAAAAPITAFTQVLPREGEPATQRTEVRLLFDADALYVGARMHDTEPVSARLVRRDGPMSGSDWLTVILDSYHDHRSAFGFEVNPSGVRRDQTRTISDEDDSWDPVWEAATTVDAEGWTAELRIPFSQLRFNTPAAGAPPEQVWGLQIERSRARNREFSVFSFTPSTEPGGIARFGHLHGLSGVAAGRRLEVLPYTVLRAESVERRGNPFRPDREIGGSMGLDFAYRLTSDLTLSGTVNPDFGQVEVDPAQVNLTAIETRFQERRPFFVEGSEIFGFGAGGGNVAFYSRRIGRRPQLGVAGGQADVPAAARILGAAKLSGRTAGGWSLGMLNATTQEARARVLHADGVEGSTVVEPLTNYFVARLRRDARAGQSVVGGMFTAVVRDLETDRLRGALHSRAFTGGVDLRQEWRERTWTLNGFVSGSVVTGEPEALLITQRAPWRYFQRPDAPGLSLDSAATSLAGLSTQFQLSHRRGRHWRFNALAGTITPGYEVNDIGFQGRANRIDTQLGSTYIENRPGRRLRSWSVNPSVRAEWNYDGEHIINFLNLFTEFQTLGYHSAFVGVRHSLPSVDDRLTRGGPIARRPASTTVFLNAGSDGRRRLSVQWESDFRRDDAGGWEAEAGLGVTARPTPGWNLSVMPVLERAHSRAQYIGRVADAAETRTFGARYLFAELDQTTLSVQTRLNVTFTPALSLQLFAQPFLASADFGDPAQLAAPRSYQFLVFGRDLGEVERTATGYRIFPAGREAGGPGFAVPDRDFNLRELRGNAVLRWEWRPGSTLFAAWQQTRFDEAAVGDFRFRRDRTALFAARPDNVLVLKVNYWFNP